MDTLFTILSPLFWLIGWLLAIIWWIVSYLLWLLLWFLVPLAIVAFVALRIAEKMLGPDVVRGYIKKQSMKFGTATWVRARRLSFALGALPLRVLGYFIVYAVWHSIVSLFWRPNWHPWQRAWSKRWKPKKSATRKTVASKTSASKTQASKTQVSNREAPRKA